MLNGTPRTASGSSAVEAPAVIALLGPTNTGKTHHAIVRMLEHPTGMIGLPLRLLAREVYDRVRAQVGDEAVALVTGEERRVPPRARYWVCTVEAMPTRNVDFLAVDEIQLCGHHERGHIFTERLLHWRGNRETWFLGAETIRPLLQELVPTVHVERRPRLSVLSGVGALALGQLPPRTAVVAFSAGRVYELAERFKLKRGGAAVVLGALSPRTRNAQVAMYQAGEVDFLVATDAIGMGLNMNVDCVAFADLKKYDGRHSRALEHTELAQIAGRAGRNRNDGSFCTLAPLAPLPFATQKAIEEHRFAPLSRLYWRNADLDFDSTAALARTLARRPFSPNLVLTADAEDQQAFERLVRRSDVAALAVGHERVQLLWQVCQIPDFRKLLLDDHFELLGAVYVQLCQRGKLGSDWVRKQVERLDDVAGELDTLLVRMAAIRTWTFITHRTDWLDDAEAWQERTLAIEDKLSDALHDQLVSRFVDRHGRRGHRVPKPRPQAAPKEAAPTAALKHNQRAHSLLELANMVTTVSAAALERAETRQWADASDARFSLRDDGRIYDLETPDAPALARLGPGAELLRPEILILAALPSSLHTSLRNRLGLYVQRTIAQHLGELRPFAPLAGSRGWRALMYGLQRGLGSVQPEALDEFVFDDLTEADWAELKSLGFVRQPAVAFLWPLAKPDVLSLRWALVAPHWPGMRPRVPPPSLRTGGDVPDALKLAAGYAPAAGQWKRLTATPHRSARRRGG